MTLTALIILSLLNVVLLLVAITLLVDTRQMLGYLNRELGVTTTPVTRKDGDDED